MPTTTLSQSALEVIERYLRLPFNKIRVACPYFNNKVTTVRGALRVLIGKGSPEDIVEEARIIGMREKIDLDAFDQEQLTRFLVNHHLGVDCSALVYYVLDADLKARGKGSLRKYLSFPYIKNPLRKLLSKLRTVEQVNVKTLSHESNSREIKINDVAPGDFISMLETGEKNDLNHLLLIHAVEKSVLHYTHSLQWKTDGRYGHGVRQGTIAIMDREKSLTEHLWTEQGKTGEENETLSRAKTAKELNIRRIKTN